MCTRCNQHVVFCPRVSSYFYFHFSSTKCLPSFFYLMVRTDQKYDMFVTTLLLKDGTFWLQLATVEEPAFLEMVERLQVRCMEEPPTPVLFSPGDYCAAQFSEDEYWYRARVEEVVKNKVRWMLLGFW